MRPKLEPVNPAIEAFEQFQEVANKAALTGRDRARLLSITRQTLFMWAAKRAEPYESRDARIRSATRTLRAHLAATSLPAPFGGQRRAIVTQIVKQFAVVEPVKET